MLPDPWFVAHQREIAKLRRYHRYAGYAWRFFLALAITVALIHARWFDVAAYLALALGMFCAEREHLAAQRFHDDALARLAALSHLRSLEPPPN